jgi:acetolactate synthase I/III small subunit
MSVHTLSVLVENKPGVLARIAGLFSRRGFNIDSLAVGPTEHAEISRMTIVVNVEESPLEQVTKQLNKLVEVIKIVELEEREAIERELLLVKVKADVDTRSQVLDVVQLFKARVVDVATDAITLEVTGNSGKMSRSGSASWCSPAWSRSAAGAAPSPSARCARCRCRFRYLRPADPLLTRRTRINAITATRRRAHCG